MKRVRIMLMVICLVALVGGVLAFKAMTPADYCYTNAVTTVVGGPLACVGTDGLGLLCPNYIGNTILTTTTKTANIICTVIAPNPDCTLPNGSIIRCLGKATITIE